MGPLAELTVVELGGIGPVPFCGMLLADLGATVIRLDRIDQVGTGSRADEPLLTAMERQMRRDVRVGCRRGGCGVCKVKVLSGRYRTGPMSRSKVTEEEQAAGVALACRLYPESELQVCATD